MSYSRPQMSYSRPQMSYSRPQIRIHNPEKNDTKMIWFFPQIKILSIVGSFRIITETHARRQKKK
jgi:hypothetical protein